MDDEKKVVTWNRFESHGYAHYRSRDTVSRRELAYDGDGWCLSQDGDLLEWYVVLDEAMAWVAEEEARLRGPVNGDCEHQAEFRSLLSLYDEVFRREMQCRYDDCIEREESWYKGQPDAYLTSHWDALRAVRNRIDEIVQADWRSRQRAGRFPVPTTNLDLGDDEMRITLTIDWQSIPGLPALSRNAVLDDGTGVAILHHDTITFGAYVEGECLGHYCSTEDAEEAIVSHLGL